MCGPIDYGAAALSMYRLSLFFAVAGTLMLWKMRHFVIQKIKYKLSVFAAKPSVNVKI